MQRSSHPLTPARTDAVTVTVTPVFLRMSTVVRMTGLGCSTICCMKAEQQFPRPVRLGPRAVTWHRADLDRWSEASPSATH